MLNNCLTLQTKLVISKKLAEETPHPLPLFVKTGARGLLLSSITILTSFKTPLNPRLELFDTFECR